MVHGIQAMLLVGLLALWFQLDPDVRRWEAETVRAVIGTDDASTTRDGGPPRSGIRAPTSQSPTTPQRPRPDPSAGDSPKHPIVDGKVEFPGPGWYRVKCWRGWFPEKLNECLTTSYQHVANRDEWCDMYWGRWDHEVGAQVAADARMYTTDGIRLDQQPKTLDAQYATQ